MKKPQDFGKAIAVSCGVTYIFYLFLVCVTYGVYGNHLLSDPQFANVVKMLSNNWMAKVIALAMQV